MKLKKGQILYIDNQKYTVINMIEYKEDTWIWQEYEIKNDVNEHKWLSIEKDEKNEDIYYLYERFAGRVDTNELGFLYNMKNYELYEKGTAVVQDYFGDADVDKYESCEYFDYVSEDKEIISVEKWEGEVEKSIGKNLEKSRLNITEEIDSRSKTPMFSERPKSNKIVSIIIILICIFPFLGAIVSLFSGMFVNKSMENYIEKETSKYTYVTSITNNTNNKKAKVYKSSLSSVDSTVKDIIDGVPEGITDTIDSDPNTEEDGIGLKTDKEYAYIYEENGEIFIQVSSREYINNSGTMYHSRHYHHYYNTYGSTRRSNTYSSYAYSARQKSVNSRTSSGGGTSSGK